MPFKGLRELPWVAPKFFIYRLSAAIGQSGQRLRRLGTERAYPESPGPVLAWKDTDPAGLYREPRGLIDDPPKPCAKFRDFARTQLAVKCQRDVPVFAGDGPPT